MSYYILMCVRVVDITMHVFSGVFHYMLIFGFMCYFPIIRLLIINLLWNNYGIKFPHALCVYLLLKLMESICCV